MVLVKTLKITVLFILLASNGDSIFLYANSENWGDSNPACDEDNQSPIDIVTDDALHQTSLDSSFDMSESFFRPISSSLLENTGQYYKLSPFGDDIQIIGGGGLDSYPLTFQYLSLHFGSQDNPHGAEHTIDGHRYSAEMQLFFKSDQVPGTIKGGYAIWAFFLEVYSDKDKFKRGGSFDALVSELSSVRQADTSKNVSNIKLSSLVPIFDAWSFNRYYRYSGSFSVPPCIPTVEWTIFKDPLYISKSQYLKMVQGMGNDVEPLVNNYRPTQPIGDRLVSRTGLANSVVRRHMAFTYQIEVNCLTMIATLLIVKWML